ncbi:hypothetical protein GGH20_001598, partial [Coemansia sp. RSA 1937]
MDIVPLVSKISSCVEPGSVDRNLLHQHLTHLALAVRHAKATNVESTSLLTHITLVAARLISKRVELSDRERELVLETVCEALTPKAHRPLDNVHAVVVDHIGRILVPLFITPSTLPEATRMLAIGAWRQLVKIASVYVPEKHSTQSRQLPCTHRAMPLVSPWWRSRGLSALLTSLSVSLPGTSLLISEKQEHTVSPDGVSYVLENYRTSELSHALDLFVQSMADLFTPRELGAQLLSLLFDSSEKHVEVLWMLRKVAGQAAHEDMSSICPSAFQYCVDFCGTAPDPDTSHAVHELMVLDVISTLVPMIGSNVAYYMDTLLFPLLQTTTSSSPALQAQAHRVLEILAQQTLTSVSQMLHDNVDYIVEGCSQQIRAVTLHPRVFNILCGAVLLVGRDILVYMDDVVEDTLDVCERLAYEDEEVVLGALQFLEIVTRTVADESKMIESTKERVEVVDPDPIATAVKAMDDAVASRMLDDLVLTDPIPELPTSTDFESTDDVEPSDTEPDDTAPEGNPLAIKICLSVQSFLYADSSAHQLLALKTVHNSTNALQSTRDLLPLLNEVWPSLVNRLSQRDAHYVTLAACDVIERVCTLGSSWMRKRVKDDLWPHFERILQTSSLRMQRSECTLIKRVLCTMGKVVECVPLDEGMAWTVCVLVVRFFGTEVEPELVELLQQMTVLYGDK